MPRLSRVTIRLSLVYLVVGFTFGGLMLANKGLAFEPALWQLRSIHIELLLIGWMAQLAIGVAYWILPRFQGRRGNIRLAWLSVLLLNLGLLVATVALALSRPQEGLFASRLLTSLAVVLFGWHAFPRVKPPGA